MSNILECWLRSEAEENGVKFQATIKKENELTVRDVALKFNLNSSNRKRKLADSRAFFCWFCYDVLNMKVEPIGEIIDRHYTTVIHGKKKARALRKTNDKEFAENTKEIKQMLINIKPINKWTTLRGTL